MMRWLFAVGLAIELISCSTRPAPPNKFADIQLQKIYDLQDRRVVDSLLLFLQSKESLYRREAAMAFGSVQDSAACTELSLALIDDADVIVRRVAAYALGQTGGPIITTLTAALNDKDSRVVSEVLQALGKTTKGIERNVLTGFLPADSLTREGQAWGLYYLTLRKLADSAATQRAADLLLPENSYQTRLAAASYFGRTASVTGNGFQDKLMKLSLGDPRPEVRMAAAAGLRHLSIDQLLPTLEKMMKEEKDYRVRVNGVRVCQNFPLDKTESIVFGALKDPSTMVQVAASEVILNLAAKYPMKRLEDDVSANTIPRVKANLYGALLKSVPPADVLEKVMASFQGANDYYKAQLIAAMGNTPWPVARKAFDFVAGELIKPNQAKVVATSAAGALTLLDYNVKASIPVKTKLGVYKQAIAQGDPAVTGIICSILMDETMNYKRTIGNISFLKDARAKLTLPRDIESIQPLDEAIAYLEGREKPARPRNDFNHPIDWNLVRTIPSGQMVDIVTTKGVITIQLLIEESPGSAGNFYDLARKGYFNGKYVHRVVPNFVIQAGCNRGDGYGSEDYSIRSEFSTRRYDTGSVGMASAGKDTEGTQWFITHCPTPHLDGKYSIFATTIKGMDVVHRTEVGDKILEVKFVQTGK